MLFPLPLTPFEHYYWRDDRPDYPTAYPMQLSFGGRLDEQALAESLAATLVRHPLLAAQIDGAGRWPRWVPAERTTEIDLADHETPFRDPRGPRIDLSREPGLRVFLRRGSNGDALRLHFHHACCDGLAAFEFVDDLLVHYCRRIGTLDATQPLSELDPNQLRRRTEFLEPADLPPATPWIFLRDVAITIQQWSKLARAPAVLQSPLAGVTSGGPATPTIEPNDLHFATSRLDAAMFRQLRTAAKQAGGALNDLLLAAMFQCAAAWNASHGSQDRRPLRILMPVDLRSRLDRTMPCANRMSFSFLARPSRDGRSTTQLLTDVHRQTEQIRAHKLGLYFLGGLGFASAIPGAVGWALDRRRSFATVCLSNVGRVFARTSLPRREGRVVCGDAVLESVSGVPPIRPYTRAAMVILNYAGGLSISVRCDPHGFTPADTQAFLDRYLQTLDQAVLVPNGA